MFLGAGESNIPPIMELSDVVEIVHFRELHLLPRTIFSIGVVLFIGSFFLKSLLMGAAGISVIFFAILYNLIVDTALELFGPQHQWSKVMLVHCFIALALLFVSIGLTHHLYVQSELSHSPPQIDFQPEPPAR